MKTRDTDIPKNTATPTPIDATDTDVLDSTVQTLLRSLDAQTGQYDVATQIRLNEARARAIAATRTVPFWRRTPVLAAAFAMAAAYTFVILTPPHGAPSSADIEALALYEATFGADGADEAVLDTEVFDDLNQNALDESALANDLEFYAWLSENANAARAPAGSGS